MIERCPVPLAVRLADGSRCLAELRIQIQPPGPGNAAAVITWGAHDPKTGERLPLAPESMATVAALLGELARETMPPRGALA